MRTGPLLVGMVATAWVAPVAAVPMVANHRHCCGDVAPSRPAPGCVSSVDGDCHDRRTLRSRTEARLGLTAYLEGFHDLIASLPRAAPPPAVIRSP